MQVVAHHGDDITLAVLESMPYADAVIKEVMRLHPPIGCQFRRALKDFPLGDYTIRKVGPFHTVPTFIFHILRGLCVDRCFLCLSTYFLAFPEFVMGGFLCCFAFPDWPHPSVKKGVGGITGMTRRGASEKPEY